MEKARTPWSIPSHVPPERVLDFDFFHPPGAEEDVHLAWHQLQQTAPDIFWTPHYGGHWVVTRAEDIHTLQTDHERFSHDRVIIREGSQERPFKFLPVELDPPEHTAYRGLLSPTFSLKAVMALEDKVRQTTISLIEGFVRKGECEFVREFAQVMPVVMFMGIVDLPEEDRHILLPLVEAAFRATSAEAEAQAYQAMAGYLYKWVAARTEKPGQDLISHIVHAKINGQPLKMEEVLNMIMAVLAGGLDTVASMLGFVTRFLALNPGHRRQLIENPELIPNAVDELIRCHGLVNTARVITHDFEYKGVQFKKGEQVLVPNHLFGVDERKIENPLKVDFNRPQAQHLHAAFGNGPHRCPGTNLARSELKIFLQEWLKRIPEFRIKPGTKPVQVSGLGNSLRELHLSWDTTAG